MMTVTVPPGGTARFAGENLRLELGDVEARWPRVAAHPAGGHQCRATGLYIRFRFMLPCPLHVAAAAFAGATCGDRALLVDR